MNPREISWILGAALAFGPCFAAGSTYAEAGPAVRSVISPALSSTASTAAESVPSVDGVTDAPTISASTDDASWSVVAVANAEAPSACPFGMVEVEGEYCPQVQHRCLQYIGRPGLDRCAKFEEKASCIGTPVTKRFCMDRYEYPNRAGQKPAVAVTGVEARKACEAEGKRLCTESEWTLACEGEERLPYPYGFDRDAQACNIDRPYIEPDNSAYASLKTRAEEIARVDQSEPSGARASCVSPLGVHDMTGNVDEWVANEAQRPDAKGTSTVLKGGYWGPVRNRCRPTTRSHNEWHSGYQIGFRCCSDPAGA